MKLWATPCRATRDGQVIVESSDKTSPLRREWQTTPVFLPWEPHEGYEKVKTYDTRRWAARLGCVQYATGEKQRNSCWKNEEAWLKQKQHSDVDVSGGESKVSCCKEQYCIVTWNVRSMNQGEFHAGKQKMARVNVDILRIRELKWDNWVACKMGKSLWL